MGQETGIGWTHHTFNGWRGCLELSPACAHCYARIWAARNPALFGEWGKEGVGKRVVGALDYWGQPLRWDRAAKAAGERRRVFAMSMADVFEAWTGPMLDVRGQPLWVSDVEPGRWLPWPRAGIDSMLPIERQNIADGVYRPLAMEDVRDRLFGTALATPNLDWLLLTKRISDVEGMVPAAWSLDGWPSNVWLGTTVEDRKHGLPRIDVLRRIPAPVRFLSIEPLLEDLGEIDLTGIHWVIVGGESGPNARPFNLAWARSLIRQCREQGARCFFKQAGSRPWDGDGAAGFPEAHRVMTDEEIRSEAGLFALGLTLELMAVRLRHPHGADPAEWDEDLRVQEFPSQMEVA